MLQRNSQESKETSNVIEEVESGVRSYCRSFPEVFACAQGSYLYAGDGRPFLDFFAGAGALNYGHNHPLLKRALVDYIARDGVAHSLDMITEAKEGFLASFRSHILDPRGLDRRVMFTGPTGTNAVEAALMLARKVTGRTEVVAFTRAFHGMTLGSLAATGNNGKRDGSGVPLTHVTRMPFAGYHGRAVDTLDLIDGLLSDPSSGVGAPAAFLLETVQAEGGINVASSTWLQGIAEIAERHGALLIVDDIQVGCGRTGPFFSFERADLEPDIICLSKSLSGYGLPFAVTMMRPDLDVWEPGEHNGTFRGNNHAFVTAKAALDHFWNDDRLTEQVDESAAFLGSELSTLAEEFGGTTRGRGLIQGLAFDDPTTATAVSRLAFERGLIIETAGSRDEVVKFLPPLTVSHQELTDGLAIVRSCLQRLEDRVKPAAASISAAASA